MSTTVAAPAAALEKQRRRAVAGALIGLAVGAAVAALFLGDVGRTPELLTVDLRYRLAPDVDHVSPDLVVLKVDDDARQFIPEMPMSRVTWAELIEALHVVGVREVVLDYNFSDRNESERSLATDDPWANSDPAGYPEYDNHQFGTELRSLGLVALGAHVIGLAPRDPFHAEKDDDFQRATGRNPKLMPFLEHRLVPLGGSRPPRHARTAAGFTPHLAFPEANILVGARAIGIDNILDDPDGALRRFAPFERVDDDLPPIPSLGLAAYALTIATPFRSADWGATPPPDEQGLPPAQLSGDEVTIAARAIPISEDGSAWVRWRGNWEHQPRLTTHVLSAAPLLWHNDRNPDDADYKSSISAILVAGTSAAAQEAKLAADTPVSSFLPLNALRGKIVLIGLTMQGEFQDSRGTPFGYQPGVYYQASILDTLLTGDFLRSVPRWLDAASILAVALLVGLLVLGVPQPGGEIAPLTVVFLLAPGLLVIPLHMAIVYVLFRAGWIANAFHAELAALVSTSFSAGLAWVFMRRDHQDEQRRRQKLDAVFTRVVSPDVAKQLLDLPDPGRLLEGERRELTVYFSDIAGFTTISERLAPEQILQVLNEYLTRITELLQHRAHATVDKYIGDAVMAFWGAPIPAQDGPVRACYAALDAKAIIDEFSRELAARGLPPFRTRIGLNTGPAVVGEVGHPKRASYTALGDTVNLASRLEGANKAYGTVCMMGPETYERAKDHIVGRELDLVKVKGKHIPVKVYELMGRADEPLTREREIKRRYEAALARFRAREFVAAKSEFERLRDEMSDGPSAVFVDRCEERIATPPPPDWDGSNELHEK